MNKTQELLKKLLQDIPLPPDERDAAVHRSVWADSQTGTCLGVVVLWAYGPVSAFLMAQALEETLYGLLPPAAQELVDCGESLLDAARFEAKRGCPEPRKS